jgi:hypothetical protein
MPISPSKSRDLTDENNKILTEWCGDEETLEHFIFDCPMLASIRNPVIDDIVEALHIQYLIMLTAANKERKQI